MTRRVKRSLPIPLDKDNEGTEDEIVQADICNDVIFFFFKYFLIKAFLTFTYKIKIKKEKKNIYI